MIVLSDERFPHYLENLKVDKIGEIYDSESIKFSILIIRHRNYSILRPYFTKRVVQNEPSIQSSKWEQRLRLQILWSPFDILMKLWKNLEKYQDFNHKKEFCLNFRALLKNVY